MKISISIHYAITHFRPSLPFLRATAPSQSTHHSHPIPSHPSLNLPTTVHLPTPAKPSHPHSTTKSKIKSKNTHTLTSYMLTCKPTSPDFRRIKAPHQTTRTHPLSTANPTIRHGLTSFFHSSIEISTIESSSACKEGLWVEWRRIR